MGTGPGVRAAGLPRDRYVLLLRLAGAGGRTGSRSPGKPGDVSALRSPLPYSRQSSANGTCPGPNGGSSILPALPVCSSRLRVHSRWSLRRLRCVQKRGPSDPVGQRLHAGTRRDPIARNGQRQLRRRLCRHVDARLLLPRVGQRAPRLRLGPRVRTHRRRKTRRTRPKGAGRPEDELEKKKFNHKSGASSAELRRRGGEVRPPPVLRADGATKLECCSRRRRRTVNHTTLCRRLALLLFSSIVAAAVIAPVLQLALSSPAAASPPPTAPYPYAHPIAAGSRPAMLCWSLTSPRTPGPIGSLFPIPLSSRTSMS